MPWSDQGRSDPHTAAYHAYRVVVPLSLEKKSCKAGMGWVKNNRIGGSIDPCAALVYA